jgi:hypothetical protein
LIAGRDGAKAAGIGSATLAMCLLLLAGFLGSGRPDRLKHSSRGL